MKPLFILTAWAALTMTMTASTTAAGDEPVCALEVRVTELQHDEGQVFVSLFDSEQGFPGGGADAARVTLSATPKSGEARVAFAGLPCGAYAVAAHHDEDGDGKMKAVYGTIPLEGVGISNDAKGIMGPPKFKDARFELAPDSGPLLIVMRY